MIFDRTQSDVDEAKRIRAEKVQKFVELTAEEIKVLEKGTLTINTINRIENKQEDLRGIFNDMGYWNTPIINKYWQISQIFNVDEFRRIIDNTRVLKNAFWGYKSTPAVPMPLYRFDNINAIEKILNDLDLMINDVKSNYRYCGEIEAGDN